MKKAFPKNVAIFTGKQPLLELLFSAVGGLKDWNFIKRDPNAGVFLLILCNFLEELL